MRQPSAKRSVSRGKSILAISCAALLATLAAAPEANAALLTWDPNVTGGLAPGGDGTWDFAAGPTPWYDATLPGNVAWTNGNDALFGGLGGTVNVGAAVAPLSVKFDANYTLSGSAITTATVMVKAGATTTANNAFSGAAGLTIGIASSSTYAGTLILGGASNYAGTTLINSGTVKLGIDNALPIGTTLSSSANPGGVLDLNGFNQILASINGASQGTITNTSATRSTVTIGTISNSSQVLAGNLNVTKTGTGTWNPAIAHTFTGILTLAGGNTTVSNNNNLGAIGQATVVLDGSGTNAPILTFNVTAFAPTADFNRNFEIVGTGGRFTGSGVKASSISGAINGSGDLRYGSATQGALILAGSNTYTGLTKIENTGTSLIAASDQAFGASSMISQGSTSTSATVGFQKSLTNQNINIGTTTSITFQAPNSGNGLGSIHNFNGDNSFAGNIIMANSTQLYAAETGSSLLLKGVISGSSSHPFIKGYGGTLILSGANTFSGNTTINNGTLRLDYSQSPTPTSNIINNAVNASTLILAGGTLEIKGRPGGIANNQQFAGLTVNAGSSALNVIQNGNTLAVSMNLSALNPRAMGGTVDFTLPTIGFLNTSTGSASAILTANSSGVAYATVGGNDWAAKDATNTYIVGGSTIAGFYTPNDASTLSGNADMSGGVDTDLGAAFPVVTSLRFNNATGRNITNGTLQTGGILVTTGVGANPTSITNGFLLGTPGKDLVVLQNNAGAGRALTISSTLPDNATSGLTKAGPGTVNLTTANTYMGVTTVTNGVLELSDPNALPGGIGAAGGLSNLTLKGGVVGLTGNFSRGLGTGAAQVQFTGNGGFAAYGADRTVNFGVTVTWNTTSFVPNGYALLLGASDATHMVDFQSPLVLLTSTNPQLREIRVADGAAATDGKISGVISGASGLMKTGPGTLELSATNTYDGATEIDEGTLLLSGTMDAISSGAGTGFFVNNGSTLRISSAPVASHYFAVSAGTVELTNSITYTALGLTMGGGASGTTSVVTTGTGTIAIGGDGVIYNGHFNGDSGATISGNLSVGTTVKPFVINDSPAAANDLLISAVISGAGGGIAKSGNGTLTLAAVNTYTGATTVNAGKLLVTGSLTGTSGAVTVNNGGTLGGTGSVSRTVAVNTGATLAPGSTTGTFDIANTLTLAAGSILKLDLGGNTPGDGTGFYDQVNMTDPGKSIALNAAATLSVSLDGGYLPQNSDICYVLTRADAAAFSTSFVSAAEGSTIDFGGGVSAQITYVANWTGTEAGSSLTGGNDVAFYNFVVVPEPATSTALLAGLAFLGALRRRRVS